MTKKDILDRFGGLRCVSLHFESGLEHIKEGIVNDSTISSLDGNEWSFGSGEDWYVRKKMLDFAHADSRNYILRSDDLDYLLVIY